MKPALSNLGQKQIWHTRLARTSSPRVWVENPSPPPDLGVVSRRQMEVTSPCVSRRYRNGWRVNSRDCLEEASRYSSRGRELFYTRVDGWEQLRAGSRRCLWAPADGISQKDISAAWTTLKCSPRKGREISCFSLPLLWFSIDPSTEKRGLAWRAYAHKTTWLGVDAGFPTSGNITEEQLDELDGLSARCAVYSNGRFRGANFSPSPPARDEDDGENDHENDCEAEHAESVLQTRVERIKELERCKGCRLFSLLVRNQMGGGRGQGLPAHLCSCCRP